MKPSTTDRGELNRTIEKMFAMAQADEAIKQKLGDTEATLRFEIEDLNIIFATEVAAGQIEGYQGEPRNTPYTELRLDSDTFDSLFSGEITPMAAFMSGKLKFNGNIGEVMALQSLISDLFRLYQAAKATD